MTEDQGRTVVILQPGYLPWLGFFDQMFKSHVFVVYDDVQFDKHGWRNRNRIKSPQGYLWLTVPVLTKGHDHPSNRDVLINNRENWPKKHLASIRQYYAKAPYFPTFFDRFQEIYGTSWNALIDLDMAFMRLLMDMLGLEREIFFASDLSIQGGQTERLVSICRHFGAQVFLEGDAGKAYLDETLFRQAGITVAYHGYRHPVYRQLHGDFLPYLSVVDLLFNQGPESLNILVDRQAAAEESSS